MTRAASALRAAVLSAIVLLALLPCAAPAGAAAPAPPAIRAPAAILVEPATGDIVFERNAHQRRLVASTTKLMTALVTLEHASLDDVMTTVPYDAAPAESIAGFRGGERVTVRDLLRALLITSANDAAETLATRVAGSPRRFVAMMNARARSLKLTDTHYANPIGLDAASNYSSATDLVKLTLILRRNAFFRRTTDLPKVTLRSGAHPRTFVNRNTLVTTVPAVNGVKTGHTNAAGYLLVGSATRHGVTVLSAVLDEPSEQARDADSLALLRYGLRSYRVATAVRRGQVLAHAKLEHRDEQVDLVAERTLRRTTRRGDDLHLRVDGAPSTLDGPLPKGARIGTVVVVHRGRAVARVPLVTASAVDEATILDRLRDWLDSPATIVLLGLLAGCSVPLVLLRRRAVRRQERRRAGRGATVA
ncbi:MAG TPA: D-alanyl-D-alanine carboxypeptidase family protein [Baekduia sp.]|nr:D-alanyl-D-alanine carboxypeptidase family protein [Baekduia sp.]